MLANALQGQWAMCGVVLMLVLLPWQHLQAQLPSTAGPRLSKDTIDRTTLATITTDTGAYAPGHHDFSRYTTPGLCQAAAEHERFYHQNGKVYQARVLAQYLSDSGQLRFAGDPDTVGAAETAVVARACGARFTLASTPAGDRGDLFLLALHQKNDSLAQTILATLAAHERTADERNAIWLMGFQSMLTLGHRTAAEALRARFRTRALADRQLQLQMLDALIAHDSLANDAVRLRQETGQIIDLAKVGPDSVSSRRSLETAYETLLELAADDGHPDSLITIALRAKRDLSRFSKDVAGYPWGTKPVDSVLAQLAPDWYNVMQTDLHLHHHAPRLQADYWFPAPGSAPDDTLRPVPGKINVICLNALETPFPNDVARRGGPVGVQGRNTYASRWLKKYEAAGVVFTMVEDAHGYLDDNKLPIEVDGGRPYRVTTPADEAQIWHWWWHVYTGWPGAVAIQTAHPQWLPLPDGRRWTETGIQYVDFVNGRIDNRMRYLPGSTFAMAGACAVIGRDGTILYDQDSWQGGENAEIERVLNWTLGGPGAMKVIGGGGQ